MRVPAALDFPAQDVVVLRSQRRQDRTESALLFVPTRRAPVPARAGPGLRARPSYGALARKLGRPNSARAVGLATGANPIAIVVPCHRVIGADASLTGYGGGVDRKRWLLAHEGAATPSLSGSVARQFSDPVGVLNCAPALFLS